MQACRALGTSSRAVAPLRHRHAAAPLAAAAGRARPYRLHQLRCLASKRDDKSWGEIASEAGQLAT